MVVPVFTVPSFAKINWGLRILGKRPDGYHEIRTLLQTVSLHDELHFTPRGDDEIVLGCDDSEIPTDESNLILRAANALRTRIGAGAGAGISIRLEKRIPAKAGLGGGSSNAAMTLLALAYLWQRDLSISDLMKVAAIVGADVPFFLMGGQALGTGTGGEISALSDCETKHLLIISPRVGISTAAAYSALCAPALTTTEGDSILSISRKTARIYDSDQRPILEELQNDFEDVIFDIEPEIERAKSALVEAGARGAMLAGSGSSVFGIFDDREGQQRALHKVKTEVGWRIFPCVTVSRAEYARALNASGLPLLRSAKLKY